MSDPSPLSAPAPGARWWVEAEGRAWGPYPVERLARFLAEGRLGAASRVAQGREGPFAPAANVAELASLFPDEETPVPAAEPRPLLVFSDSGEAVGAALEAALEGCGPLVRVRPGLWLVRAREDAAALRNALSRRSGREDVLLVAEAPLAGAAWFNLDGETDRRLRGLWAEPAAEPPA